MKTVYSYNPASFEYIGEASARKDPLEKEERFLIPANATEKKPIFKKNNLTKFINGKWVLEDVPAPHKATELTSGEKRANLKNELISARESYLSLTDWHIIKELENPNSLKKGIKGKRALAREDINKIESVKTLASLKKFSITFE